MVLGTETVHILCRLSQRQAEGCDMGSKRHRYQYIFHQSKTSVFAVVHSGKRCLSLLKGKRY